VNVNTTVSVQRAVWRTVTAVRRRVCDGAPLVKLVSACWAGPHGVVGGGVVGPVVVGRVVEGAGFTVLDDVADDEVEDPLDLVVLLALLPPLWHAVLTSARATRATRTTGRCVRSDNGW
jgi:hypothetical protein